MKNIKDKLQVIDKDHLFLLIEIGKIAREINQKAYLVGGMVRDLLLGFDNLDIDIVVENNAHLLAETLVKKFPNSHLSAKHDRFHTAKVIFNVNGKNIPVDLASTREETYEHPAALPKVSVSDLEKDLIRRDFTINALAVSLLPDDFGEVVDLFNGLEDLENKKIRILHDQSFIDDPTRMIRAVRFACKLSFKIEEKTQKLLNDVVKSNQFDNLIEKIRGDRVKIEIRYLFNLPDIENAIKIFFESGVYRIVSTELKQTGEGANWLSGEKDKQWLIHIAILIKDLSIEKQDQIMKNLHMTSDEIKIIKDGINASLRLSDIKTLDSIIVHRELKNLQQESVSIVKLLIKSKSLIDEFIDKTSKIKLEITGDDLIAMGIPSGKQIGEVLQKILEYKINYPNIKQIDELKKAADIIKQYIK